MESNDIEIFYGVIVQFQSKTVKLILPKTNQDFNFFPDVSDRELIKVDRHNLNKILENLNKMTKQFLAFAICWDHKCQSPTIPSGRLATTFTVLLPPQNAKAKRATGADSTHLCEAMNGKDGSRWRPPAVGTREKP